MIHSKVVVSKVALPRIHCMRAATLPTVGQLYRQLSDNFRFETGVHTRFPLFGLATLQTTLGNFESCLPLIIQPKVACESCLFFTMCKWRIFKNGNAKKTTIFP